MDTSAGLRSKLDVHFEVLELLLLGNLFKLMHVVSFSQVVQLPFMS